MGSFPATVPEVEGEEEVGRDGSCIVRTLGRAVSDEEEARDWSRCLYSRTVPSAKPIAKWTRLRARARHDTGKGLREDICCWSLTERRRSGAAVAEVGLGSRALRSNIFRMGPRVLASS